MYDYMIYTYIRFSETTAQPPDYVFRSFLWMLGKVFLSWPYKPPTKLGFSRGGLGGNSALPGSITLTLTLDEERFSDGKRDEGGKRERMI